MAEVYKLSLSLALLIALVLTYGISSTEERPLNAALTHENENHVMTTEMNTPEATSNLNVNHSRSTLETEPVHSTRNHADSESDDVHPTTPSHSPRAGHSTGPGSISSTEERPLNAVLTHENENHVMTTEMNTPEATSNLNVNHSRSTLETDPVHSTQNHADSESDDARPTTPSHSPGAGHSTGPGSISSKEERPLNAVLTHENENHVMTTKMNTPEATSNLNVNHSRSTLETDSVHSTRNHADFESDGFRPTGNGPAPGVGHSIGPGGIPSH